jgi:hypothetical protein
LLSKDQSWTSKPPISVPEIRRLLVRLLWTATRAPDEILAWSRWRRRHEKIAQEAHQRCRLKRQRALYY